MQPSSPCRLAAAVATSVLCAGLAGAQNKVYTTDADFDEGTLVNVNHDPPNQNQLQLNFDPVPFPFVNIAISGRGTAVRINVNDGTVLGEYSTNPDAGVSGSNPSRTTVDQFGNVWVANRNEFTVVNGVPHGSIMRYGLVLGGTRVDEFGVPAPNGQYLAPPFDYSTVFDRDGDGLIKTSRGLGNVLPWTNAGGVDTFGGVTTAEDECILNYVLTPGTGTRTLAIDAQNDVWVGNYGGSSSYNHVEVIVTGLNATLNAGTLFNLACGGYGGFIDGNDILWSAGRSAGLLRYDTVGHAGLNLGNTTGDYGLGLDPTTGHIWHSSLSGSTSLPRLFELDPLGNPVNAYIQDRMCQGVAVDANGHVWVAELFGDEVLHYAPDPMNPGSHVFVGHVTGFAGTTGVAVDANGKIWASEQSSSATRGAARIDPSQGPIGGGGFNVGAIDMTVGLGSGGVPYNYSDMTGFVLFSAIQEGTWTVVFDTAAAGTSGCRFSWDSEVPAGTGLAVEVRAADVEGNLPGELYVPVLNGADPGVVGRFIETQVRFSRDPGVEDLTPILYDLTIGCNDPPVALCQNVTVGADDFCMAEASVDAGSYDPNGDPITIVADPLGPYPLGTTLVTLTVTDVHGAFDVCTATVEVVDMTPPVVTLASMTMLWPPNHHYQVFDLAECIESVVDNCEGEITVHASCSLYSIGCDEPEDAPGKGDGNTLDDIVMFGPTSFMLRKERQGNANGRIYTLDVDVFDSAGNSTRVVCYVGVPHNKNAMPIDDGVIYTVVR